MSKREGERYVLASGPDVRGEDVVLPSGRRLTEDVVQEIVEEGRETARRGGRPSLGATGSRSPQVAFRLPADRLAAAQQRAEKEGTTVSELGRRALEEYLATSPSRSTETDVRRLRPAAKSKNKPR